jgi:hypothetical protein
MLEDGEHTIRDVLAELRLLHEPLADGLARLALQLVHDVVDERERGFRHTRVDQQRAQESAIGDARHEVRGGETERPQHVDGGREQLRIRPRPASPTMSRLSWKCSRRRPRCARS